MGCTAQQQIAVFHGLSLGIVGEGVLIKSTTIVALYLIGNENCCGPDPSFSIFAPDLGMKASSVLL